MKRVLILEDNAFMLDCLSRIVQEVNVKTNIIPFDNVKYACNCVLKSTIDLAIIDIMLEPHKSGDSSGLSCVKI